MTTAPDGWIAALDRLARGAGPTTDEPLEVDYRLQPSGGAPADAWRLVLGGPEPGARRLGPDEAPAAVGFETDPATAQALADGELSAGEAFLAGRLRLLGDVGLLIAHRDRLGAPGAPAQPGA